MLYSFLLESATKLYDKYQKLSGTDSRALDYAKNDIKRRFDKAKSDSTKFHSDAIQTRIKKEREFDKAHKAAKTLRKRARLGKAIKYGVTTAAAALGSHYDSNIPFYAGCVIGNLGDSAIRHGHKETVERHHKNARNLQKTEDELRKQSKVRDNQQKKHIDIYDKLKTKQK